jgi:hypothetical protein
MTAAMTNSRPDRKQLSDQLDRLDGILDGLSQALNEAVADAARQGVREAVKEAVVELLTNPDLKAALHRASTPADEPRPSFASRLKAKAREAASRAVRTAKAFGTAVASRATRLAASVARLVLRARSTRAAGTAIRAMLVATAVFTVVRYGAAERARAAAGWVKEAVAAAAERLARGTRIFFPAPAT